MVDAHSSVTSATESTNVMPLMGISLFLALQFLTEPSAFLSTSDGFCPV